MKFSFSLIAAFFILFSVTLTPVEAQPTPIPEDLIYVNAVAWSHDGTKIAAVGIRTPATQGYIRVLDVETGETLYALDPNPGGYTSVDWSPDDRFIAMGSFDQSVWVVDLLDKKVVAGLFSHRATVSDVSWSADGKQLVSAGNWDGLVILWDMVSYKKINTVQVGDVWTVGFSPDNQHIAIGGSGLQIYPSTLNINHSAKQRNFNTLGIAVLRWSHDGTRIAFGTQTFPSVINPTKEKFGQLYVIDSTSGSVINSIYSDDTTIYGVDWSADDKLIATYSNDGFIKIWRVDALALLQSIDKGSQRYPVHISFSPYGGRLAFGGIISSTMTEVDIPPQTNASGITNLLGGAVEIIVPVPSFERLKSVMNLCDLQSDLETVLAAQIDANDLKAFTEQVTNLTAEQISLGCKADVLAVAKAILATAP